jgi:hypothetical protein
MTKNFLQKALLMGGVLALSATSLGVSAADNTDVTLNITSGALTIYAGDSVDNNDICTQTNIDNANVVEVNKSNVALANVTCSLVEDDVTLGSISVASSRQTVTTSIQDIVFEDLRGSATSNYTITATVSDFVDGTKKIELGTNPDTANGDLDPNAPTTPFLNTLFAVLDPSAGIKEAIRPGSAISAGVADLSVGSLTTVVKDTSDASPSVVTLLNTTAPVITGRYDLDATAFKLRVPAFVEAGSYSGAITLTIV